MQVLHGLPHAALEPVNISASNLETETNLTFPIMNLLKLDVDTNNNEAGTMGISQNCLKQMKHRVTRDGDALQRNEIRVPPKANCRE